MTMHPIEPPADDSPEQESSADPYVLKGSASITVEKIALKNGDAFLVADDRGDLPDSEQETGLYWRGTRYLRACDLFLEGKPLATLSHSISDEEGTCLIDLANPFLRIAREEVYQGTIHIRRLLELREHQLRETLELTSFYPATLPVKLGLKLSADFRDIFEVRGLVREERGQVLPPRIRENSVILGYRGLDNIMRETICTMTPTPTRSVSQGQFWDFELHPGMPVQLQLVCDLTTAEDVSWQERTSEPAAPLPETRLDRPNLVAVEPMLGWQDVPVTRGFGRDVVPLPIVRSDNVFFNSMLKRGMHDLVMMTSVMPEGLLPYGGVPWYVCPFGRDALITSLEFLPWFPEVTRGTLGFLAAHQGTHVNDFTEEEPGRILHEYRTGELANCREIPFIPYYGTVDATPLYLVVLGKYIRWTNDMAFLRDQWQHAQAAARWIEGYGDRDGDGFVEYAKVSGTGLVNQGWKDSWDAVTHADGALAPPPIALCEVQGYVYAAYQEMSYLAKRLGEPEQAAEWESKAELLRLRFNEQFWWEDEQAFYLALDGQKRPCRVVSSNAGQCLWTGIVPPERAASMVTRLMAADMYTGWGIRTLSSTAARYNPMSYHNGSVWPHDTALIGAGFAEFGRSTEVGHLLGNLFGVSLYYSGSRLPELFCGFTRTGGYGPTRYPVACSPQSWAAGAPFLLLSSILGFVPEAEHQRLTLIAPTLPSWMRSLELGRLRLGKQELHLNFERSERGTSVILADASEIVVHVVPRG